MNGFPEKILLATDGLTNTGAAARAVDLAGKGGAELRVVHVWIMAPSPHAGDFIRSGLEEIGRDRLDGQVRWIEEAGGTVAGASLAEGRSVEGIIAHAGEVGADLIVAGSRGMGRLGRMVIGSVSTGLAHRSHCPVLIVPEGEEAWPPDRVLVGFGSFEDTERAGFLAASLARALGAEMELVGVEGGTDAEERLRSVERRLESRAEEIEDVVGLRLRMRASVGEVGQTVLEAAAEGGKPDGKPALLGFGSKVMGGAGRVIVEEALDQIFSKSRGPILITPELHSASRVRILERREAGASEEPAVLVATDGSEVSLRAGEYATRLADGLGAKLFVLHVVDERRSFHGGIHYGEFVERLSEEGREATGKVRELAEEADVECEELIVLGRPDRAILAVADEVGTDLIILGAEGKSRMERALIGSVSEEALRRADRTVLVVGGHPENDEPGQRKG